MASKKKTNNKKTPAKKAPTKKAVAKKKASSKKQAAPKKKAKPKKSNAEQKIAKEVKDTIQEVKVVMSKKEDVLSELAKDLLEEKLNQQVVQEKVGFFKRIFGFKK